MSRMGKLMVVILVLSNFYVHAQVSKTDGPLVVCKEPFDMKGVIGVDNNAFYVYRKDKKDNMFVQRYNKKTFAKEWETDVTIQQKTLEVKDWDNKALCYLKGGKIYLYVPAAEKEKKRGLLLLTTLGTDGKVIGNLTEIGVITDEFATSKYFDNQGGKYTFSFSPDSSKMLFIMEYYIISIGNCKSIATIDLKNPKAASKEISDGYHSSEANKKTEAGLPISSLGETVINNDGKVAYYFTSVTYKKSILATKPVDKDIYGINIYDPATKTEKMYAPNYGNELDMTFKGKKLQFVAKDKLMYSAIIADSEKQKGKKKNFALFIAQVDVIKGKTEYETSKYFSDEWREKYNSKQDNPGFFEFSYTPVNDGGYIISAYKFGGESASGTEIDDALLIKTDGKGTINWMKSMPIKETIASPLSKNGLNTYVSCIYTNNKMYYVFNDHAKNEAKIDMSKVETSEKTKLADDPRGSDINTTCITVDMNGAMQRTLVQAHANLGFYPLDKNIWLDKNKLLLYYKNRGKECFSTLTIQ